MGFSGESVALSTMMRFFTSPGWSSVSRVTSSAPRDCPAMFT